MAYIERSERDIVCWRIVMKITKSAEKIENSFLYNYLFILSASFARPSIAYSLSINLRILLKFFNLILN